MKNCIYILSSLTFIIFFLVGCKKTNNDPIIQYAVYRLKGNNPYSVWFKQPNGNKIEGPINTVKWLSPLIEDFKSGQKVFLKVEHQGGNDFELKIIQNGMVINSEEFIAANSQIEIEAILH